MSISQCVYNKSGHQIVVIIFLSCIIVFLDIEQFYADILCSTTVNFFLGVVFFDIVILPVQYLFLLGYNKLFILSITSFEPDEAGGIFGWVTFCLLFLIPWALGSVHYLSLGGGGRKIWAASLGGHWSFKIVGRGGGGSSRTFSHVSCTQIRAQLFEGRLALNPGLKLTLVPFSCFQKHLLG